MLKYFELQEIPKLKYASRMKQGYFGLYGNLVH